jgi:hypothetical protein
MPNCSCLTKKLKPCKNRVSQDSIPYNGSYMCFKHIQQIQNRENGENGENGESVKSTRCLGKTKKGKRCVKKTKSYTGFCSTHENKIPNKHTFNRERIINESIKSPNIKYKINNNHDNCYICLDETTTKLSCGHFIHSKCLLETIKNTEINSNNNKSIIFEHENEYFIVTTCLYCKQISIIKNIKDFKFKKRITLKNILKKNIKMDNKYISYRFNILFQLEPPESIFTGIENNIIQETNIEEFTDKIKRTIFDMFGCIVFENYIQQKSICKIPKKYSKINKDKIIEEIKKNINNKISKKLYKHVNVKLYNFLEILEDIFNKINSETNIQDEYINLMNVF